MGLLGVVETNLALEVEAAGRATKTAGVGTHPGQVGPVARVQGRLGINQPPLKEAGAPDPGQLQAVDEVGGHPLAAPVGEVAAGEQFAQLGIDQGMAAIGVAPALE